MRYFISFNHIQLQLITVVFCLFSQGIQAVTAEVYSVSVNGKKYKFVYLLNIDNRLAAGENDLKLWGIQDKVGNRAVIPGTAENLKLYWLDDIESFDLQFDHDDKWVKLNSRQQATKNRLSVSHTTNRVTQLERGKGVDITYRAASFSRPGSSPLNQLQGDFGFSMGSLGRITTVFDADNQAELAELDDSQQRWQYQLRDTRFERDFDSGYQLRLGQLNGNRTSGSHGLRFLGMSWGTNALGRARVSLSNGFSNFEDVVTLQQPADLEVRVNGQLVATRKVGVGRLSVSDIPISTGANYIELLLRYADGTVHKVDRQVVGGSELINPGQSESSFSLGVLAENDGFRERYNYEAPYARLNFARGITNDHTVIFNTEASGSEGHYGALRAEWVGRLSGNLMGRASGGWSSANSVSSSSVFTTGLDETETDQVVDRSGIQSEVSLEIARQRSSFFLGANYSDEDYLTLRQSGYATHPKLRGWVNWQFSLPKSRGFSTFYRYQENHDMTVEQSLSASYRAKVGTAHINVSLGYDDRDVGDGFNASVNLSMPFTYPKSRLSTFTRANRQSFQQSVRASSSLASNTTGTGWSVHAQQTENEKGTDQSTGGFSTVFRSQKAEARLTARFALDDWYFSGEARGSLVFVDEGVYVTRPVGSSFVLVDTGEAVGANVYANNRRAAVVDNSGKAFIPFVQSYSTLNVGIDPASLTSGLIGNSISNNFAFAPGLAQIQFPFRKSVQATGILLDGEDMPWPLGSEIRSYGGNRDGNVLGYVGKDGLTYLSDLVESQPLQIEAGLRSCVFEIPIPGSTEGVFDFGRVTCD